MTIPEVLPVGFLNALTGNEEAECPHCKYCSIDAPTSEHDDSCPIAIENRLEQADYLYHAHKEHVYIELGE